MIRVLIADDHPIVRAGLRGLLEAQPGIEVVGEAETGEEVIDRARTSRPDVVLLDVTMPGRGGIETAQELKRLHPKVRVLMLTVHPEDHFAVRCLREGADGYLTKDVATDQLVAAVRKLHAGGKFISASLAERLAFYLDDKSDRPLHERLSGREFEVMRLIAAGRRPSEIAAELHLSTKTVSTYRTRILEKMNLRTNAEIMRYVLDLKLEP